MVTNDGTDTFQGETVGGEALDEVCAWHGNTKPTGGTNDIPQGGIFIETGRGIYLQNGSPKSSPSWTTMGLFPRVKIKTADQTRTSTTYVADTHLTHTVLASTRYTFRLWLNVTTANAPKFQFSMPSGGTVSWTEHDPSDTSWSVQTGEIVGSATAKIFYFTGSFDIDTTAGSVGLQFASNSGAVDVTVAEGSHFELMEAV